MVFLLRHNSSLTVTVAVDVLEVRPLVLSARALFFASPILAPAPISGHIAQLRDSTIRHVAEGEAQRASVGRDHRIAGGLAVHSGRSLAVVKSQGQAILYGKAGSGQSSAVLDG